MNIAVDAMGGDHAPEQIVLGALAAAPLLDCDITLVGDPASIERHLPKPSPARVLIHPASEVVGMDEKPLDALRKKKDSSLVVAANLVKEGVCSAMVSAGNTGAATAAALLAWRQVSGVHRPAIGSLMPNRHGGFLLLDAGASPDVDPEHLVEFAVMGVAYAQKVMGRANPRVFLLNIGEEPGKGNAFAKQAFSLMSRFPWFGGNIEGKDVFRQPCDVVVCDAFVGNIVLKTAEGVAEYITQSMRELVLANTIAKIGFIPVRKVLSPLRKQLDYAEYGGSPLLGLNGVCVIGHGRSNSKAIKNALLMAQRAVQGRLVDTIREAFAAEGAA